MRRIRELPLVSILIPNYNHAKYLSQCIESAIIQTYPRKEIVLIDNDSTDNSIKIAKRYMEEGLIICKNQCNIMNYNYKMLANEYCRGEYFILLCADDYLQPDFIEYAVAIMEKYPHVGYVQGERDFVTPENECIKLDPFYRCSFVAPGRIAMPIYMLTSVAHPAQAVIRKAAFDHIGGYDMEIDHLNADRSLWFYLSYEYDVAYIRNKMSNIRIGFQTETMLTQCNFQHPILYHLTIKEYIKFAYDYNIPEVYQREKEALQRLAKEFVGFAGNMLYINKFDEAKAYLLYAKIVSRIIIKDKNYRKYEQMIRDGVVDRDFIHQQNELTFNHKRGYEPPKDYEEIYIEEIEQWMKQEYRF